MFFDRREILIQAFVHFTNGKLIPGHSSSSTFHDFVISYGLRPLPPAPDHCSLFQDCRFLAVLQADLGIFGTQTCHLAWLVASLWRLGGSWPDFGTLGSITKESLRSRPTFFRFWMDFGAHGTVLGDPGLILRRSWDIRDYKTGHCELQAWSLSIFGWFRGPI